MMEQNISDRLLAYSARRLVRSVTGHPVTRIKKLPHGMSTFKFSVRSTSGASFIVRFYPRCRSRVVEYEPDLLRRASEAGAKVPEVVADSRTGPEAELGYMIYVMIPGVALSQRYAHLTPRRQEKIAAQIVQSMLSLEQVKMAGYGELVDGCRASCTSWPEFVQTTFAEGLRAVRKNRLLPGEAIRDLEWIAAASKGWLTRVPPKLVWADVSLGNVIVNDKDEFGGLIDFEGALSADRLLSLGYCRARYDEGRFYKTLVQAWPEPLGENRRRRVELYAILRALRLAPFAHEPLPTGHRRDALGSIFPGMGRAMRYLRD